MFISKEIPSLISLLKNKRFLKLIMFSSFILTILSMFGIFYYDLLMEIGFVYDSIELNYLLGFFFTLFFFSASLLYLQSGIKSSSDIREDNKYDQYYTKEFYEKLNEKISLINALKEKLTIYEKDKVFTKEEKQQIIDRTINETSEETIKQIFSKETSQLEESIEKKLNIDKLKYSSEEIVSRLRKEISDLSLRSNINLVLGMFITICGLYLLWDTVDLIDTSEMLKQFATEGSDSDSKFLKSLFLPLLPRIILVIFIELFAYFFLRLYKEGLSEIKYFQNELTNIESKLISLEIAYVTNQLDSLKVSLEALSQTERNFILKKGQTTKELEKEKLESGLAKNIIKMFPNILNNTTK
jgi:hypothetical protein